MSFPQWVIVSMKISTMGLTITVISMSGIILGIYSMKISTVGLTLVNYSDNFLHDDYTCMEAFVSYPVFKRKFL